MTYRTPTLRIAAQKYDTDVLKCLSHYLWSIGILWLVLLLLVILGMFAHLLLFLARLLLGFISLPQITLNP